MIIHRVSSALIDDESVDLAVLTQLITDDGKRAAVQFLADGRAPPAAAASEIVIGSIRLDPARYLVTVGGRDVELTVKEFRLLEVMARRPGHVKSRSQFMDALYLGKIHAADRTKNSHVKRIRRKPQRADPGFDKIFTIHGVGHKYDPASSRSKS